MPESILVIACGALAREISDLKRLYGWNHLQLACIDARLHNRPELIAGRLREKIRRFKNDYDRVFVAYADCGTGGAIDAVLDEEGIDRLPGAHCYEAFAGSDRLQSMAHAEPGTFYLTDFLARNFDRFVIEPLQLDKHPQLRDAYFGNYRRVVYLSQMQDTALLQAAEDAARRLGLEFEHVHCGYGALESKLQSLISGPTDDQADHRLLA